MITKTKAGIKVRILRKLPPFISDGNAVERVLIENIDGFSPSYGRIIDVNLDALEGQGDLFNRDNE